METDEQGIVLFAKGREHLITRSDYEIRGEAGKKVETPAMAWATAVPRPPDEYSVEDAGIFDEIGQLAESILDRPVNLTSLSIPSVLYWLGQSLIGTLG